VTKRSTAEAALLATTVIWGGTFPVVKIGLQTISPLLMIAVRFLLGSLFFLAISGRKIMPLRGPAVTRALILSLFLFLGFVAQNIGLAYTTASKSAFITSMMVIFVPLLQFVIERRAPVTGNIIGVLVVTSGLWFLTAPTGSAFNLGDALTLVCAILFAVYIVYLDVVAKQMSALQLTALQMVSMTAYASVATWLFETPVVVYAWRTVFIMLYLSVLATVVTTYVQTRFQKDTTPTRAAVIFTIEPVVASVAAFVFLGENLGPLGILGGGMIIAGVLVSEFSESIVRFGHAARKRES